MNKLQLMNRYIWCCKYILSESDKTRLSLLYSGNKMKELKEELDKLPTDKDLLIQLTESLKGKPVYKTLKKLSEGKLNKYQQMKGLFSLGTHATIKVEHGENRFAGLLPMIHHKLGELLLSK